MRYRHILRNSGIVHAQQDDSDWLVCGKPNEDSIGASIFTDTDDPITCKVCKRSLELSHSHRLARELSALARMLYQDTQQRPGAYLHADRNIIQRMIAAIDAE